MLRLRFSIILLGLLSCACSQKEISIRSADVLYNQFQTTKAYKAYESIFNSTTFSEEDRLKAVLMLSKINWLLKKDFKRAEKIYNNIERNNLKNAIDGGLKYFDANDRLLSRYTDIILEKAFKNKGIKPNSLLAKKAHQISLQLFQKDSLDPKNLIRLAQYLILK